MTWGEEILAQTYHFIFMDIVGFSKRGISATNQVRKIQTLNNVVTDAQAFTSAPRSSLVILPTGDGMAIGFRDSCERPYKLAIDIARALTQYNKGKAKRDRIDLRIGLHAGAVYPIKDINRKPNICGPGVIICQRVMDFGDAGHILASDKIAEDLKKLSEEYDKNIKRIGKYKTKHGEQIILYNVSDGEIGSSKLPLGGKIFKSRLKSYDKAEPSIYQFLDASLQLEITDLENMLVRHRYSRRVKNISDQARETHFCQIWGDIPRSWEDLNLEIYDEQGRTLDLEDITLDQPMRKEFLVKFREPLYPDDPTRASLLYTVKWDWEEPKRCFEYTLVTQCDRLDFSLIFPKVADIKLRVYEIEPETGVRHLCAKRPRPTEIKGDKASIRWIDRDIRKRRRLRFTW